MNYYRDLDLKFIKHPITGDVSQVIDTESVKKSIKHLLLYKKFEKPFHPEITSGITDAFFNNLTSLQINVMRDNILRLLKSYEPRAIINDINLRPNLDGNSLTIDINFSVKNVQTPINFSVKLSRSR